MADQPGDRHSELHVRQGGSGSGPTLVLLHGLGATGRVWGGFLDVVATRWPGRWVVPDLAGHGRSPQRRPYSFGRYACEVAGLLDPDRDREIHVVGHSMGGVVALALASGWFGVAVARAVGIGIKVSWSDEDVQRAQTMAARDHQWFPAREEAVARYLRVSGLAGLVEPADPVALDGASEGAAGWRLAQDPATFGVGVPDISGLIAAARCDVVLAAGEHDRMSRAQELRALHRGAIGLPGLGHNAHVEDPGAVWDLVAGTPG